MDCSLIKGDWSIGLSNGRLVDLLNIQPRHIDIRVIAHSLAMQCRYGGHVRHHYSVAQHSWYVSHMIEFVGGSDQMVLAGLLHDGSEAYLQDLVRGIKVGLKRGRSRYAPLESKIQDMIYRKYGVPEYEEYHEVIKYWDNAVLGTEIDSLIPIKGPWRRLNRRLKRAPIVIQKWSPEKAEKLFMKRFNQYAG